MNQRYQRLDNESDIEYGLRLVEILKTERPDDLEWDDIKVLTHFEGNKDSLRKANDTVLGGYSVYKYMKNKYETESFSDDKVLNEYELKKIELQKEKQKFFDQRTSYKALIREESRWEQMFEIIENAVVSDKLPKLEYKYKPIIHTSKDLLVGLNDLHYGADIDNAWNTYNSDICKERLNNYINEILEIKEQHNAENIFVSANGDLISGTIHRSVQVGNREDIIEQVTGVSELISQFLAELSNHFNTVTLTVVAGNHSRLNTKKEALKNERLDILIPWYAKARLQNFDNIYFTENIDTTMGVVDIRGKKYLNIHGDYDSGKSAKQACALMTGEDIYAIFCGHLHHNSTDYVDKMKVLMSGSLLGMDDYTIQKRIVGIPQQLICVCDESGVKCTYDINF